MSTDEDFVQLASKLHAVMSAGGEFLFLPTGAAFLGLEYRRRDELTDPSYHPNPHGRLTDADVWGIYSEWHEGVHLLQLVTSPYLFDYARSLASLGMRARILQEGVGDATALTEARRAYASLQSAITTPVAGYSSWDILETHAVCLGIRWLTPHNDGKSYVLLANAFYNGVDRPADYVKLLNAFAREFGDDEAFVLLPRLCHLAMQSSGPAVALFGWIERLRIEGSASSVSRYSLREFCSWAGFDPNFVARSLNERVRRMKAPDDEEGEPRKDAWLHLFDEYFDALEKVLDVDDRLELLMGVRGAHTARAFSPTFTVFGDGVVQRRRFSTVDTEERREELKGWLHTTLALVEGLQALQKMADPPGAVASASAIFVSEHRDMLEGLARLGMKRGQPSAAFEYLRKAWEISVEQGDFVAEAVFLSDLVIVAGEIGKFSQAREYAAQAIAICRGDSSQAPITIRLNTWLSRDVAGEEDDAVGQELHVCNLLKSEFESHSPTALSKALKLKEVEGNVHGNLATIAHAENDVDLETTEYKISLELHREVGLLPAMARTLERLGELADRRNSPSEVHDNWHQARDLWIRMDDQGQATRLAARIARSEVNT